MDFPMKKLLLLTLLLPGLALGQKIENWKAALQGDKILITYDLVQGATGDKYNVSVYSSYNNFSSPLQKVTGDVGRGITGGRGKQIIWDGKNELKGFKGELTFEIRAEVMAALAISNAVASAKRGKDMPIAWRGGTKGAEVKIELVKDGVATVLGKTTNTGNYNWSIPTKQKTGSGYQLRLTSNGETAVSPPFSIKPKVPTLVKVIPLVAIAAVVGMSGGGSGGGTSTTPSATSQNLPIPPDLGLN